MSHIFTQPAAPHVAEGRSAPLSRGASPDVTWTPVGLSAPRRSGFYYVILFSGGGDRDASRASGSARPRARLPRARRGGTSRLEPQVGFVYFIGIRDSGGNESEGRGRGGTSRLEPPSLLFYFIGMRDSQGGTSSPPSHNVNCNPPWKMADHFSWNAPSSGQTAAQSLQPKRIALVVIEQVVPNPLTCSPACEYPRPNHGYAMPQEKGSGEDFLGQSRVRQTEAATRTVLALGVGTATSSPYLWIY